MMANRRKFSFLLPVIMGLLILISGGVLADTGFDRGATAYAVTQQAEYALAYQPYTIKNYTADTFVQNPRGDVVPVTDGVFTPLLAGQYTVVTGGVRSYVTVFQTIPKSTYSFDYNIQEVYSVGELIRLPKATITSAIEQAVGYTVYIEFGGKVTARYSSAEDAVFQPQSTGEYTAVYTYKDYFGYISNKALTFTVDDEAVISYVPPLSLAFNKEMAIIPYYAYSAGNKFDAVLSIQDPDGMAVDISGGKFKAAKLGDYRFTISATVNGEVLSQSYTVKCDLYNKDLFEAVKLAYEPVPGVSLPEGSMVTGDGVMLQGSVGGATFRYSNIINMNEITRDKNIISFMPYSTDTIGYMDDLVISLTDIHDPYNKVQMQFKRSPWHDNLTFVTAAYNERHYAFDNENWVLTGVNGPVKIGDRFFFGGIMRNHYSMIAKSTLGLNLYSFTMDYPKREVVLDLTSVGEGRYTIVDFDNPVWVGGSQYTWNGFTTGEAYLTIEFGTVTGNSAAIIVTEIMGQSLSGSVNTDTVKPSITIDVDKDYLTDMPYGVVGKQYYIPVATAQDVICGEVVTNRSITRDGVAQSITGNSFVPEEAGNYAVTYAATDAKGNTVTKVLEFVIYATSPEIDIALASYSTPVTGKYFQVPSVNVSNASGKFVTAKKIKLNGRELTVDAAGKVFVSEVGELTITATVTDYLGNVKEQDFVILVTAAMPVMSIPYKHMTAQTGQTLYFSPAELTAFDGEESAEIIRKITVNGAVIDGNYTVKSGDTTLAVNYEVTVNGQKLSETYEVIVGGSLADRFDIDNGTMRISGGNSDEVWFDYSADGSFALKNPVSHNELRVSVSAPRFNFDSLDVYLTDYNNPDVSVFVRLTQYNSTQSRAQLNGQGDYVIINGSLSAGTAVTFFYDSTNRTIKAPVSEKLIFGITRCVNGDVFHGFESGGVSLRVEVNGVSKPSSVRLNGISNETFVTYILTGRDSVAPVIGADNERAEIVAEIGTIYQLPVIKAFDVLQGMFDVKVSVFAPDGTVIFDDVLMTDNMSFVLNRYGEYIIEYQTFQPQFTIRGMREVTVIVKDKIAPVITVAGNIAATAELGATIKLPSATATDDVTDDITVRVLIYDADYRNIVTAPGESYRFMSKGKHRIVFYARDGAGNIARLEYSVEVK